ncbi:tetratricopeptide (TPR) repeat protein [Paraburkholderia bannensis]|uniref:Tetratricopeptide (TPR) repeat protein n=1 Tax=Paraburkholderia bannensis TaxID=765414 RepID=A0A7W9TXX7_9BURK|nr:MULTISPECIES: cellulose biosynthesis protein BcsC [Paraburkholderia]MBB3258151.1 tetratricopeptide (TPR) repeat protein [Paraburkholderia sp. WP4_3_2]MBB6103164.1 tetratricopeptide (TPR) repeat protein [Paraburkholderia bannensis]
MSVSRSQACILGLLLTTASHPVWAQDATSRMLLEQGRYWQAHDKPDLAAQSWQKLLLTDPKQPEGLYGMASVAIGKKQFSVANDYLARLRAAAPDSRFVPLLEQDLRLAVEPGKSTLARARQMAQDAVNQNDIKALGAAIAQYNKALGGKPPQGAVAREYYTYLGYTEGGTDQGIQGLTRLNAETPNDPYTMLALAQHQVRDEHDRAAGVALLEKLATRPDIGGAATEAWRSVLTWVTPTAKNRSWFEDYLKLHPDDDEIRHQMLSPRAATANGNAPPVPVMDPRLTRGFAAFKAGDVTTAEQQFSAVLRDKPNDTDALGGLGLVRMQQGDLAQAQTLLSRAASRPGAGANWSRALASARYWLLVNQAEGAQSVGDYSTARRDLDQALRMDPAEAGGRNASARLYAVQGDLKRAEAVYRGVLADHPNNREAVSGLVDILAETGRADEAQKWVDSMTPEQQAGIGGLDRLRAAVASGRADAAEQRGDLDGAKRILEDAQRADPDNPWLRLELARYELKQGHADQARELVDGLLESNPDNPDALYASALLAMQMGDWARAQDTMARIPAAGRTPNMVATSQLIDFQAATAQASQLAHDGNLDDARNLLARLEASAGKDPARVSALASAYVDAGNLPRAMSLMRGLMPNGVKGAGPDVQLAYAGLLLKTGQNVQAQDVMRELQTQTLSADQRRQLDDLSYLYAVRLAEQQRQQGDLAQAYDTLAPVLAKRPNDSLANAALARMYAADGQYAKALALYQKALSNDPDNPGLQLGVAMAAVQAGNGKVADAALKQAIAKAPNDPDVLAGAARIYVMQGKTREAQALLETAIAAKEKRMGVQAQGVHVAGNPFVHEDEERRRRLRETRLAAASASDTLSAGDASGGISNLASNTASNTASNAASTNASSEAGTSTLAVASSAPARDRAAARSTSLPSVAGTPIGSQGPQEDLAANAPEDGSTSLDEMRQQLDDIRAERSPEVRGGLFVSTNNSAGGTSQLTNVQMPTEVILPAGNGKLSVRVTPVELESGTLGVDSYSSSQFGGGPSAALAQKDGTVSAPSSQTARGVGLGLGYETRNWAADIGTTPLGFQYTNIVGGVSFKSAIDAQAGSWFNAGVSRRAVTDSITSFAGTSDARSGLSWGGVTATGLHGAIGVDTGQYGFYGYGSVKYLDGHNVQSNEGAEVGGGTYWYLVRNTNSMLTAGMNLSGEFYRHNENNFTYGNGGYFSPQRYYAFTIPVTWAQRSDRWTYKLQGSAGLQYFHQSAAPYFPTDSALQSAAVTAASSLGLTDGAIHPAQSSTGIGYNLLATAEYRFSNHLSGGASVGANNSSSYRQWVAGLYLRFSFAPQTKSLDMPVMPYQSHYSDQ